jgi:hypothetical protein
MISFLENRVREKMFMLVFHFHSICFFEVILFSKARVESGLSFYPGSGPSYEFHNDLYFCCVSNSKNVSKYHSVFIISFD